MIIKVPLGDKSELAAKAIYRARKVWNELLDASGGPGAYPRKFTHNIRRFCDEMLLTNTIDATLTVEAIRQRVKATKGKDTGYWP